MKQFILRLQILTFCLGLSASLFAQPIIQWEKTIGGPNGTSLRFSEQTADGGFILGGTTPFGTGFDKTGPGGGGGADYWILKLDATGQKEWDRSYGGGNSDILMAVHQTADGGYILGGNSNSDASGEKSENCRSGSNEGYIQSDYWIVKVSPTGEKEWDKTIGAYWEDWMTSVEQTPDGGYIIGGSSSSAIGFDKTAPEIGYGDLWVVKLNAGGSKVWDKSYGVKGAVHEIDKLVLANDGGYVLSGDIYDDTPARGHDYKIFKLASDGSVQWDKRYGGSGQDNLTDVIATNDGGYLVGGFSDTNADGDKSGGSLPINGSTARLRDYWILKLNAGGEKQWDRTIGGTSYDAGGYTSGESFLSSLAQTSDGGYVLGGYSSAQTGRSKTQNNKGKADYWIVKINAAGNKEWDKTIGGNSADELSRAYQTADGGFLLTGSSRSNASGDKTENTRTGKEFTADGWVVKLAPENPRLPQTTLRINAGGPDFTTATKKLFIADKYYAGVDRTSSIASGDILNTTNDVLYRSGRSSSSFSYNIPVFNGQVNVTLHFAEIYFGAPGKKGGAGSRQFHVNMEGNRKLTNYDIFTAAGGAMRAVQLTIPVTVTDGVLNIDFLSGAADLPRVSAIEVIATGVILNPMADAFVRGGSYSALNYGTAPTLDVKTNLADNNTIRKSYLKFSLAGISNVGSATLRVYGSNYEDDFPLSVYTYAVDDNSWTESGITFANAPARPATAIKLLKVNNVQKYYEVDVTSLVQAQLNDDKMVSFLLENTDGRNKRVVFNSREAASKPPQLVIQTTNMTARQGQDGVLTEVPEKPRSTIYPNPVKDQFTVSLSPEHAGPISFEMINADGRSRTISAVQTARPGENAEVNIARQSFNPGIYLLKIKSDAFTEVIKAFVTE